MTACNPNIPAENDSRAIEEQLYLTPDDLRISDRLSMSVFEVLSEEIERECRAKIRFNVRN